MEVIHHLKLDAYGDRIQSLDLQPLKITLETLKPIAHSDPLHLDGFLAKAVVLDAMQGDRLPPSNDAYWIPLPLGLERVITGLPLWQSTDFIPCDRGISMVHLHQRSDANPYAMAAQLPVPKKRRQPATTEGQYMSYRRPVQYEVADKWEATCIGNLEECDRLLNTYIDCAGKEGARGFGRVAEWRVEPIATFELKNRPIPIDGSEPFSAQMAAWTPPYWHKPTWRLCHYHSRS